VQEDCTVTQIEITQRLAEEGYIGSHSTVSRIIKGVNFIRNRVSLVPLRNSKRIILAREVFAYDIGASLGTPTKKYIV
ncbi:hypothetical protein H311_00029, partial [Anncaliia algerae PRA109]